MMTKQQKKRRWITTQAPKTITLALLKGPRGFVRKVQFPAQSVTERMENEVNLDSMLEGKS